jgi:hypothetical protein
VTGSFCSANRAAATYVRLGAIVGVEVVVTRETVRARTMVELADNLVADFDIVDLLTTLSDRCVEVLDIAAAGIMLAAADGKL